MRSAAGHSVLANGNLVWILPGAACKSVLFDRKSWRRDDLHSTVVLMRRNVSWWSTSLDGMNPPMNIPDEDAILAA